MKKWANKKRRHIEYKDRDMVLVKLLPQQFKSLRPVNKGLVRRYEGPFPILGKVGKVSYRVQLPPRLKIHPVFHVSYLKPYHEDKDDPRRGLSKRAPITVVTSYDKEVEHVLADRVIRRQGGPLATEYLVKWKGLPESEASWEPADALWQFQEQIERARKLLKTPRVGRVWKVLEMPGGIHTTLHYGGRHERSPQPSREFQRDIEGRFVKIETPQEIELEVCLNIMDVPPEDQNSQHVPPTKQLVIRPHIVPLLPTFHRMESENPYSHIKEFEKVCNTFQEGGASIDLMRLKLFPFTLKDKAKIWLNSLRPRSILTWTNLQAEFLKKFLPTHRTNGLKRQISNFSAKENEKFYECWERYMEAINVCPHHGFDTWLLVSYFYDGMSSSMKQLLETMCGGDFMSKNLEEAMDFLSYVAEVSREWDEPNTREVGRMKSQPNAKGGMYVLNEDIDMKAKVAAMARRLEELEMKKVQEVQVIFETSMQVMPCSICQSYEHLVEECPTIPVVREMFGDQANVIGQFKPNNNASYGNTYNSNWRNHPNFSWKPKPPQYTQPGQAPQQTSNLEQAIVNLNKKIDNVQYAISRLTNLNTVQEKGKFPSQPHQNPKEKEKSEEIKGKRKGKSTKKDDHDSSVDEEPERIVIKEDMMKKHMPPPFPQASHGKKGTNNASEIFKVLRQVKANIPLLNMIKQVPTYAKFLKDLCTVMRGLNVNKKAFLIEQVSTMQCKSPLKHKDLGCPTISVSIEGTCVEKALLDLGASVNLLPYSVYKQLRLGELKPTSITLSLADRSVKIPRGMIKDVLVQVDKFYYLVDFVVLDTNLVVKGTNYVPIILKRPFLATSNAIINCRNGVMQLTFGNMTLELNIFHSCKKHIHPEEEEGPEEVCMIDTLVEEQCDQRMQEDLIESLRDLDEGLPEPSNLLATLSPWRRREEILPLFNEEETQRAAKEEPPKLILKPLPTGLKYAYLEEDKQCLIVISSTLTIHQDCLLEVLRRCKKAIGWQISDLKGISPLVCTHHIYMEDEAKSVCQPQRSPWVSPTQVVPKKYRITVVQNDKGEDVSTCLTIGWRVCIDYKRLNAVTRKNHFPLPFIDQVLERISGHPFYCFLDGYSGYFQIEIDVQDQEKTTFTCPFGTYAYRRMSFGLCNIPATFQRCMLSIFSDMVEHIMEVFIDDIIIFGSAFDECLVNLEAVLNRCIEKDLVLNWEKCHFMVQQGIVLGHIISKQGIEVDKAKV
ncbi:Retrovirus-related Pol polyprotein from transposon 297 [Vitis vinifera]|uniref:Retrovirus-related Pol polyprotein from transposon 297 n=1 Tax=Vitis vinifera TaxID=29760 RepID=A0A438CEN8_VITVI|nr:Retrovirus-related Pol polyprotein from transposon 297 [Vitis vinifera]